MTETHKDLPVLVFSDDAQWDAWLAKNHESSAGIWIKFAKKGNPASSVAKLEAVRTALCWGWIDGQLGAWDDLWFITRFTPRSKRSPWSQVNTEHVTELTQLGRMQPAGLAQVAAAKADGRWDAAYAPASKMQIPPELQAELDANAQAAKYYASLNSAERYSICYRISTAKRAETKARHITKFLTAANDN